MGLFGSKHKTVVSSTTAPLIEFDPHALTNSVIYAIWKDKSISKEIVNQRMGSMAIKMDAALSYARKHYTLGLPNNYQGSTGRLPNAIVAEAIKQDMGLTYGCLVLESMKLSLDLAAIVAPYLVDVRKCNLQTGLVKNPPSVWSLPNQYSGYNISKEVKISSVDFNDNKTAAQITYRAQLKYFTGNTLYDVPLDQYTETFIEEYIIDDVYSWGRPYVIASYQNLDASGAAVGPVRWWYYAVDSHEYHELNDTGEPDDRNNSYPVIPIRYENAFITEVANGPLYTTGKEVLKRMGVGMDELQTGLASNPNIGDIDHAYVMCGANVQSNNPVVLAYLAEFFTYLSETDDQSVWDITDHGTTGATNSFSTGASIASGGTVHKDISQAFPDTADPLEIRVKNPQQIMSLTEHGLSIQVSYKFATSTIHNGSIGEVGHATKQFEKGEVYYIQKQSGDHNRSERHEGPSSLIIKHQIATNKYREVKVTQLTHVNNVYRDHLVSTDIDDLIADAENNNMIIPLHRTVVSRMNRLLQDELYAECMTLVINCYDRIKLKWYQTDVFKAVVMIATFAIAVYTGQTWLVNLAAAATAGVMALTMFLLETVIFSMTIQYAAAEITEQWGEEWAVIVAVVAMIASKKFTGSFTFMGETIPTAQAFMQFSMGVLSGAQMGQQNMIQDVYGDQHVFMEDAEAQMDMLEEAALTLQPERSLPFSYMEPPQNHVKPDVETDPDMFYRKIHMGNVGTLSLDVIENYVDLQLRLPKGFEIINQM